MLRIQLHSPLMHHLYLRWVSCPGHDLDSDFAIVEGKIVPHAQMLKEMIHVIKEKRKSDKVPI